MKRIAFLLAALAPFPSGFALQAPTPAAQSSSAAAQRQSPGERRVAEALAQVAAEPSRAQSYDELTLAYLRRARDTNDGQYLEKAEASLKQGQRIDPADFQLAKASVALMLARSQFPAALEEARELNHKVPDDVTVYGYIAEADIALKNYPEAESSVQWMLNMRPNNVAGLLLGARLRVIYGDPSGALDFLNQAFEETEPSDPEQQVWIANKIARIQVETGQLQAAAQTLARAEELSPRSPVTAATLVLLKSAEQHPAVAASVSTRALPPAVPDPIATPAATASVPPQAAPSFSEATDHGGVPATLLIPKQTGTERKIKAMQSIVSARPKDASAYAGLGAAFFQRARETGDVEDFQLAEQALAKSLDLNSTDLSAAAPLETMAEVCMGEHRFADALGYAQKALALGTGDLSPFATVGDAYADMGEYEKASIAYSRMQPRVADADSAADAREEYALAARTAYLKFVSGDTAGAILHMQSAISLGVQARLPRENLAWLYFELGELSYQAGSLQSAANAYLTALTIHPGDYRALAGLGKVRAAQGRYEDAITLYQSAIAVVPMPTYIAELGDIYAATGDTADAARQYKLVEYIGRLGHINQVLHNRDLALFYADHDRNLSEALQLARKEFEVRGDIYTWDALAWALYKNKQYAEADEAMAHAMRLGTQDAMLDFHAGMIAAKSGHADRAGQQLAQALRLNPHFNLLDAEVARRQLSALQQPAAPAASVKAVAQEGPRERARPDAQ